MVIPSKGDLLWFENYDEWGEPLNFPSFYEITYIHQVKGDLLLTVKDIVDGHVRNQYMYHDASNLIRRNKLLMVMYGV